MKIIVLLAIVLPVLFVGACFLVAAQVAAHSRRFRKDREKLKKTACLFLCVAALPALGADFNAGYVWTPTDRVTSTKLNNQFLLGTIDASFITGKTPQAPVASDRFVFANGSTLYYCTLTTLSLANTLLITSQTEDTTPAVGDFVLTYDVSTQGYKKSQLNSLILTNDALINARTNWPTPNRATTYLLAYDSGAWSKITRSNLFYQFFEFNTFTNQTLTTIPTNHTDLLLIWDAAAGTNKTTTLRSLLTNTPALSVPTNAATLLLIETGMVKQVTISNLLPLVSTFVQSVATSTNAVSTIAAATPGGTIPMDNTIPQSNEGTQLLEKAITPNSASNILEIELVIPLSLATSGPDSQQVACALFQDSTADALAAVAAPMYNGQLGTITLTHRMTAVTTSATTFKVRLGCPSGTITVNGISGTRLFGGVQSAWLTIREIKP